MSLRIPLFTGVASKNSQIADLLNTSFTRVCCILFNHTGTANWTLFCILLFSRLLWRCVILEPICNLKCTFLVSAFVSFSPWHASGSSSSADQACCMGLWNIWQKPGKGQKLWRWSSQEGWKIFLTLLPPCFDVAECFKWPTERATYNAES